MFRGHPRVECRRRDGTIHQVAPGRQKAHEHFERLSDDAIDLHSEARKGIRPPSDKETGEGLMARVGGFSDSEAATRGS